jgi:transcriptional regulator with XRE-family HTH domain
MEFGDRLKCLMQKRNISGKALSRELCIPYNTLQEWLSSRIPRNPESLKKVSAFFNVSVYYLLFGEENDPVSIIGNILEKTEVHTGLYEITIKKVKIPK